ncbi:hypothetical protein [Actinocatenispora rupis]|uniref:Uncharacterized protein n=1 Tax=Actinocatenispora rupis TaxID=519421 RepID=A0A8J3JB44_9ACTN|nr:hypothetical protein [Actinocatenispora rupis]GID15121.1 hypothetical protein Aru02nite_60100 [Actinocatenispora rupis]
MTRSTSWRELDAATTPPAPRRPADEDHENHVADHAGGHGASDGPVDGWTDTDEFLTVEP